jgi:hypothetical protein
MIFQLDVLHNWPYKLPQKSMDEKLSPSVTQRSPSSFISHKMVSSVFRGNAYCENKCEELARKCILTTWQ